MLTVKKSGKISLYFVFGQQKYLTKRIGYSRLNKKKRNCMSSPFYQNITGSFLLNQCHFIDQVFSSGIFVNNK